MYGEIGHKSRTQGSILGVLPNQVFSVGAATTLDWRHFSPSLASINWVVCSGTSANYTVTLPSPAGHAGQYIALRMDPALTKLVTIAQNGADTIDGAASRIMWANEDAILLTDGVKWFKVAGKSVPLSCVGGLANSGSNLAISSGSQTIIPVDTVISDPTGFMVDASTNKRINLVRPGTYSIVGKMSWVNFTASASGWQSNLTANGSTGSFIGQFSFGPTSTSQTGSWQPSAIYVTTVATDYVNLCAYQNSGNSNPALYTNSGSDTRANSIAVCEMVTW